MRGIMIALLIALVSYVVGLQFFEVKQAHLIAIVVFLVTLWTNEALPIGLVSLMPLILFPVFDILEFGKVSINYTQPIIFLFVGGFMLALGLQKLGLHEYIATRLLRIFPKTPRGIIYALMTTSALLSAFLSNTTITLMLMPIALFLSPNKRLKVRFLIATAYGASVGGIATPIGTPPNLILIGFLEKLNITPPNFLEWMMITTPVAIAMLLIVPFLLSIGVKEEEIGNHKGKKQELNLKDYKMFAILGCLVSLLLLNPIFHLHLNEKMMLLGFGLMLFLPRIEILRWRDNRSVPYEIVLLFGAGFSIAGAFIKTNLAQDMANMLLQIGDMPIFLMLFFVALFVSFSTEITSNTALTSIALPVFYEYALATGNISPVLVLFVTAIAASYAFMMPIATPPNAIIMSSNVVKIKDMAKIGFFINMIGVITLSCFAYFVWQHLALFQ